MTTYHITEHDGQCFVVKDVGFSGQGESVRRFVLWPKLMPGKRVRHPSVTLRPENWDYSKGLPPCGPMSGTVEIDPTTGSRRVVPEFVM